MLRLVRVLLGSLIVLLIVGGPIAYLRYDRQHFRNFQIVRPGVLYRSGQLSLAGLQQVVQDHGIRSVVSLRYADDGELVPPDADEEIWCRRAQIQYFRIRPQRWWSEDGTVPAEAALAEFFQVMDDPANYPVLIHCFAGAHRTGSFCAVYRMAYQGWSNQQAIGELRRSGYQTIDGDLDIYQYLKAYRGRAERVRNVQETQGWFAN
jgi:tyrosine-protein phosphatase SIW14